MSIGLLSAAFVVYVVIPPAWERVEQAYYQYRALRLTKPPGYKVLDLQSGFADASMFAMAMHLQIASLPPVPRSGSTVLFLHEMRRPDGVSRLVAIDTLLFSLTDLSHPTMWVDSYIAEPGSWGALPSMRNTATDDLNTDVDVSQSLQLFAGQLDPNNPSHFTFDAKWQGKLHTIDGWLRNDDTLLISLRTK